MFGFITKETPAKKEPKDVEIVIAQPQSQKFQNLKKNGNNYSKSNTYQ